jgi:hypothetical protein
VWTSEEDKSLIEFIALHSDLQPTSSDWPSMRVQHKYWEKAAQFIKENAPTVHVRPCKSHCSYLMLESLLLWVNMYMIVCNAPVNVKPQGRRMGNPEGFYIIYAPVGEKFDINRHPQREDILLPCCGLGV